MKKLVSICLYSGAAITTLFIGGFIFFVAITLLWTPDSNTLKPADSIIVLTGSRYRIEAGFDLLLDTKAPRLLISGVTDGIPFEELVDAREMDRQTKAKIKAHCCIEIDYVADTTETNASESAKWIEDNNIKNIILVTSHSHMPRALLQFERALSPDVQIQTYPVRYEARSSLFTSREFWLYSANEYIKYLGSWLRLETRKQQ